jgi:hypothetical protein
VNTLGEEDPNTLPGELYSGNSKLSVAPAPGLGDLIPDPPSRDSEYTMSPFSDISPAFFSVPENPAATQFSVANAETMQTAEPQDQTFESYSQQTQAPAPYALMTSSLAAVDAGSIWSGGGGEMDMGEVFLRDLGLGEGSTFQSLDVTVSGGYLFGSLGGPFY